MAMRLMSVAELELELEERGCSKIGTTSRGYGVWETEGGGRIFTVPPPEEKAGDEFRYPDWMLDDIIRQTGLPASKKPRH